MYKIIILERAVLEMKEAFKWYESKSLGLGKRFNIEVRKTLKLTLLTLCCIGLQPFPENPTYLHMELIKEGSFSFR